MVVARGTMISSLRIQNRKELGIYIRSISKFPMLTESEEQNYAEIWCKHRRVEAAHRLVTSHLFLVVKISLKYQGYGFPIMDLIAEGNIGLMKAVYKFDIQKGVRLSTYATWWIRAAIQEHVLKNWSLVKMKSTADHKKLFFGLRSLKNQLCINDSEGLTQSHVEKLEDILDIDASEIIDVNRRLSSRDEYLLSEDDSTDYDSLLPSYLSRETLEQSIMNQNEKEYQNSLIDEALQMVDDRSRDIFRKRWLCNPPVTLKKLSDSYSISCERVRQLENKTLQFVQDYVHSVLNEQDADNQIN